MEANEKRCPYCGEVIKADAMKCKHCGEWLDPTIRRAHELESKPQYAPAAYTPSAEDIADELEQRKNDKHTGWLIAIELWVIIFAMYFVDDLGFWKAMLAGLVVSFLLIFQFFRIIFCLAAIFVWAWIAYDLWGTIAAIVVGLFALALHVNAFSKYYNG